MIYVKINKLLKLKIMNKLIVLSVFIASLFFISCSIRENDICKIDKVEVSATHGELNDSKIELVTSEGNVVFYKSSLLLPQEIRDKIDYSICRKKTYLAAVPDSCSYLFVLKFVYCESDAKKIEVLESIGISLTYLLGGSIKQLKSMLGDDFKDLKLEESFKGEISQDIAIVKTSRNVFFIVRIRDEVGKVKYFLYTKAKLNNLINLSW